MWLNKLEFGSLAPFRSSFIFNCLIFFIHSSKCKRPRPQLRVVVVVNVTHCLLFRRLFFGSFLNNLLLWKSCLFSLTFFIPLHALLLLRQTISPNRQMLYLYSTCNTKINWCVSHLLRSQSYKELMNIFIYKYWVSFFFKEDVVLLFFKVISNNLKIQQLIMVCSLLISSYHSLG